jgi:HK97 gp10 family phage protein
MLRILNKDRLLRKFRRLPGAVRTAVREALEQSADELVAMMKSLVPVDEGDLRDSIGWTWGKPPSGTISVGEVAEAFGGEEYRITVYAGNDKAYHARFVEFGTQAGKRGGRVSSRRSRSGTRRSHRTHPGTAAQPFFFVSYRALKRRIKGRITRKVNKAIKRIANGG